jgi:hypothetical protein
MVESGEPATSNAASGYAELYANPDLPAVAWPFDPAWSLDS